MNRFIEGSLPAEELLDRFLAREALGLETEPEEEGHRIARGADLRMFTRSRLTEVSGRGGGGVLTLAFSLLKEAQARDESVLWLSSRLKPFYPRDAHAAGVDLDRLPVLFLARPEDAFPASAKLLGSGGFGLIVWDLASWKRSLQQLPLAFVGRLNAMARHHRASVLILTDKARSDPSLGCLVSLRLHVEAHQGHPELMEIEVVRDKRGIAGEKKRWDWRCGLPDGLPPSAPVPLAASAPAKARMAG